MIEAGKAGRLGKLEGIFPAFSMGRAALALAGAWEALGAGVLICSERGPTWLAGQSPQIENSLGS